MMDRDGWESYWQSPDVAREERPDPILLQEAHPLRPGRAVDLGAGDGISSVALARLGWRVTAVDFSTTALKLLQKRIDTDDSTPSAPTMATIKIELADIVAAVPGSGYDLAYLGYVHVLPNQRSALFANASQALARGGLLLYNGFTYEGTPKKRNHRHHCAQGHKFVDFFAPLNEVLHCVLAAGLTVEYAEQRLRPVPFDGDYDHEDYMSVVLRARRAGPAGQQ